MFIISCNPWNFFWLSHGTITKKIRSPKLVATKIFNLRSLWWPNFFDCHRRLACRIYFEGLHWGLSKKYDTPPPPHPFFLWWLKSFNSHRDGWLKIFNHQRLFTHIVMIETFFVSTPCNVHHHTLWRLTPFSITIMNEGTLGWWPKSLVSTLMNAIKCIKLDVNVTPDMDSVCHINFDNPTKQCKWWCN